MKSGMMKQYLQDGATLKKCHIATMLQSAKGAHRLSFHTPGHKLGTEDITELSFSDNLSCPKGCILEAEKDIAEILGANKSFILTDGSTSGILSMLYAIKSLGATKIAFPETSHKSVWNGCVLLGLTAYVLSAETEGNIPLPPTRYALNEKNKAYCLEADALLFTSPDYYGNVCDLQALRDFCDKEKKWLLIDGAHGGHLHFDATLHAGSVADMWVDGVHKSLPAFTQGAVVSAKTPILAEKLQEAVEIFRTTSPSYPIMASVEYALKYPENLRLQWAVRAFRNARAPKGRIYPSEDWTKLCAVFGEHAFEVDKLLQKKGIFSEFCDGNVIMFYLSPATKLSDFSKLSQCLLKLFNAYPLPTNAEKTDENGVDKAAVQTANFEKIEWVELDEAEYRICASNCGLFPPCTPILLVGERIEKEKLALLKKADNVYGLRDGKICVFVEES